MSNSGFAFALVIAIALCRGAAAAVSELDPHLMLHRQLLDTQVSAPGTSVKSDSSGTQVAAPGTKASSVNGNTTVTAPGTLVTNDGSGTKVRAPGTTVDVAPDGSGKITFPGGSVDLGGRRALLSEKTGSHRQLLDTQVSAPGTAVKSDPSGTQVAAPGTKVSSVNGNTTVTAPGTQVASNGSGTKVRAPGTAVDVAPDGSGFVTFPGGTVNIGK